MWRLLFNHFSSCMLWYRFPRVLAAIYSKWFPTIYRVIYFYTLICMYLNILLNAFSKPYFGTFISMFILQYIDILRLRILSLFADFFKLISMLKRRNEWFANTITNMIHDFYYHAQCIQNWFAYMFVFIELESNCDFNAA